MSDIIDCDNGSCYNAYYIEKLEQQLEKAEEVIRFYADCTAIWVPYCSGHIRKEDGEKARNYFKEKDK